MIQPNEDNLSGNYKYGFNTQEKTDEIAGAGNHYTAEYWEIDPRLGRRWNLDPKPVFWESGYAVNRNSPILFSDPDGDYPTIGQILNTLGTKIGNNLRTPGPTHTFMSLIYKLWIKQSTAYFVF